MDRAFHYEFSVPTFCAHRIRRFRKRDDGGDDWLHKEVERADIAG
jgi:hypothetical protein